jgi:acetate kinase
MPSVPKNLPVNTKGTAATYVLVLNAGSATLKWALYEHDGLHEVGRGVYERLGLKQSFAEWRLHGEVVVKHLKFKSHGDAIRHLINILAWNKVKLESIRKVGHRLVHGGSDYTKPTSLSVSVLKRVSTFADLAPLHVPVEVATVKAAQKLMPKAQHVGVFDTAWFSDLPERARVYALPQALNSKYHLRRFGFHGISHSYVAQLAAQTLAKSISSVNVISCHLGSGCSVAAVRGGKPVDISMGFTPLEGLVMGTRSGDIDPGLLTYLLHKSGMSSAKLEHILQHESGLKGLAGVADMREVLIRAGYEVLGFREIGRVSAKEREDARLALDVFLYRVQKYIAAYAGILGRVDAIVFTGGMGERNEVIRSLIMRGIPGLRGVPVLAIPTNEELAIAREVIRATTQ